MKKFLGFFLMACVLLVTGCKDDRMPKGGGEEVTVQFTISAEQAAALAKRQGYYKDESGTIEGKVYYPEATGEYPQISDGSKANVLIYAVYDNAGELVESLGEGYVNFTDKEGLPVPQGQTIRKVDHFPVTITLRLIRNQTYTIAFWAQAEECTAFDTQDLKAVKIKYQDEDKVDGTAGDNTLCNYELRDAFCKSETFTVVQSGSRYVVLNRPFAQINVGITKADYEAALKGNMRITQSRIHIENVATELNVVSNAINTDPDKIQAIDYEFNTIPAYVNFNGIPAEGNLQSDKDAAAPHGQEQFLKVDLNRDGKIAAYGEKNANPDNPRDETYKYLMMCYVLPADRTDNASTYSTTLDKVVVTLKDPANNREFVLADGLENLPIQRNWRTNIVGDLLTSEINLIIDVDPIYSGDYNAPDYAVIAEGVSYELVRDQNDNVIERIIYLSNAKGLQWFSDASNGAWEDDVAYEKAHPEGSAKMFLEAVGRTTWPEAGDGEDYDYAAGVTDQNTGIYYKYDNGIFDFAGVTIVLTNDVDWEQAHLLFPKEVSEYWTPISGFYPTFTTPLDAPVFCGIFDGGNHTIKNLKTKPVGVDAYNPTGLFGVVQCADAYSYDYYAEVRNIRLFNVDFHAHYRVGGIVGLTLGRHGHGNETSTVKITNCYVDNGSLLCTPMVSNNRYDRGCNVAGVVGQSYAYTIIDGCFVRNLTIRGYRTIAGIIANHSDVREGWYSPITNCTVSDVLLIADQFQNYGSEDEWGWILKDFEVDAIYGEGVEPQPTNCNTYNVNIVKFGLYKKIGNKADGGTRYSAVGNVDLDIIPWLNGDYVDVLNLTSSLSGTPSAYKEYHTTEENAKEYDTTSDPVGLYVTGITLDGTHGILDGENFVIDNDKLDNYTITVTNNADKVCAVYLVADEDHVDKTGLKNIAIHGNLKVNEGVCLAPMAGQTITFENVSVYDAQTVLTDNGTGAGTLKVTTSNFRGNIALSPNYSSITFDGTVFEPATDNIQDHTFTSGSNVTFDGCTFKAPYNLTDSKGTFNGCIAVGTSPEKTRKIKNGTTTQFEILINYVTGMPYIEGEKDNEVFEE